MQKTNYVNNIKAVLIVSVVLSHIIPYHFHSHFNWTVFQIFFMFHMPAFVFFSGVLWRKMKWKRVASFALYYIVFQVVMSWYLGEQLDYVIPQFHLWFLLSMIGFMVVAWLLDFVKQVWLRRMLLWLIIAFCFYSRVVSVPFDVMTFSYKKTLSFLPFFLIGKELTLADVGRIRALKEGRLGKVALTAIGIVTIELVYFILAHGGLHHLFTGDQATRGFTFGLWDVFLAYAVPTGFIILLTAFVPNTDGIWSYVGKKTFPIFLYHPLFTLLLEKFPFIQLNFLESCLFAALIIGFILIVDVWLRKLYVGLRTSMEQKKETNEAA